MSLDFAFFRQDETEVLWFRNHWDFFDMFLGEPKVPVGAGHDFYLTRPMLTAIIEEIETKMAQHGLPLIPNDAPEFVEFEYAVPAEFCCSEPEDWVAALPFYRVLLYQLLGDVRADGCLICGWSA